MEFLMTFFVLAAFLEFFPRTTRTRIVSADFMHQGLHIIVARIAEEIGFSLPKTMERI